MDGIINVYKPKGMTSHDVVYKIRRITGIKKVGHTGTLDPDADGVLPICIGKGTKLSDMLTFSDKRYTAVFRLGITTYTQDLSGETVKTAPVQVTEQQVAEALNRFTGELQQVPPMYSAIKIGGKKLYQLARQGIEIERPPRQVTIYAINLLKIDGTDVTIDVSCSKGTYIRTLCSDIGDFLGCGAAVAELTRTQSGSFTIQDAVSLETLQQDGAEPYLVPVDKFFDYPLVRVSGEAKRRVLNGNTVRLPDLTDGTRYKVYDEDGNFLCVSVQQDGMLTLVKSFY